MQKNLQALSQNLHQNLKISSIKSYEFLKSQNLINIFANEADIIAKDFPIVFITGEKTSLIAIISIDGVKNIALGKKNEWKGSYVPSSIKTYPFLTIVNEKNKNERIILLDKDSELLDENKGKPLYTKKGEESKYLKDIKEQLLLASEQEIHTQKIIDMLDKSGILENGSVSSKEADKILISGFKIVNRKKLYELPDSTLASWARNGILTFIDAHLKSLSNIEKLIK